MILEDFELMNLRLTFLPRPFEHTGPLCSRLSCSPPGSHFCLGFGTDFKLFLQLIYRALPRGSPLVHRTRYASHSPSRVLALQTTCLPLPDQLEINGYTLALQEICETVA